MAKCYLCPRRCGADRELGERGFCGESAEIRIARYSLHMWEEPPISLERGSGTIFFSGCSLRCEFCQNRAISHADGKGKEISVERLSEIMLELQNMGAENINLVTPTHFADRIALSLARVKEKLGIPVVYNSSGYESVDTLKLFDGLVDVYLPDFKYYSDEVARKYSSAPNYREHALNAISEMFRQVGEVRFDSRGAIVRGMIVRHLVLPTNRRDSMAVLDTIAKSLPSNKILISLMSQYTPDFALAAKSPHTELHRGLTTFEYDSVAKHAAALGLEGFCQEKSSANKKYTPDF